MKGSVEHQFTPTVVFEQSLLLYLGYSHNLQVGSLLWYPCSIFSAQNPELFYYTCQVVKLLFTKPTRVQWHQPPCTSQEFSIAVSFIQPIWPDSLLHLPSALSLSQRLSSQYSHSYSLWKGCSLIDLVLSSFLLYFILYWDLFLSDLLHAWIIKLLSTSLTTL